MPRSVPSGIDDGGGVVVDAGRALLEERGDERQLCFACAAAGQLLGGRARDRLGQIEQRGVFALAEVLGLEKLGEADDVRAAAGGVGDAVEGLRHVVARFGAAGHLD